MPHTRHAHGPLVRALREARGETLANLAAAASLDLGHLSRVERGQRRASAPATARLAEVLGVDVAVLTGQVPALRTLRERLSTWTVDQFAGMVGIGVAELEAFEQGTAAAPTHVLAMIAQRLGVPVDAVTSDATFSQEQTTCPA